MAGKKSAAGGVHASPSSSSAASTTTSTTASPSKSRTRSQAKDSSSTPQDILQNLWKSYVNSTPQRVLLIDTFMAFLIVVGVLQFAYCVLAGNYPFNAFLAGFSATVGQFVLTEDEAYTIAPASLRIQTNPENKAEFESVSDERAFADYIFGSLLLHFFCVNFIN
ncbi:MAG: oligosaccharyltransferase complex subunit epsilon [Thelocarpon superellum]|nr:MAG: oligosaccharyltransferase complex subunit epsilon [Thelocarpon superellum]